jgi:hypothetical protein
MARRDVTGNMADSFKELTAKLKSAGFNVDHYHGIDFLTTIDTDNITEEMRITRISPDGENSQVSPDGWEILVADEWHD